MHLIPEWKGLVAASLLVLLPGRSPAAAGPGQEPEKGTALVVAGKSEAYHPLMSYTFKGTTLQIPLSLGGRVEGVSPFAVDRQGTELDTEPGGDIQVRVGLSFNTKMALAPFNIAVEYEHDAVTGAVSGMSEIEGEGLPNSHEAEHELRKAYGRVSLATFAHLYGGLMTSHWGLGLLANDGAHGWHPGSAALADPRRGDRVARLMLASGPLTPLRIVVAFGHDWVQGDDVMLEGDEARQFIGAVTLGKDLSTSLGFYGVYRHQQAGDGDITEVAALDLYASTMFRVGREMKLTVELEAAIIVGQTDLAPSAEFPKKDVLQAGAAVRISGAFSRYGWVMDYLFCSGDSNFDDGQQNAFKADPNFEMSLLLHRYVVAAQSGRAAHTAADPTLSGYAAEDLDRFATRQSLSNIIAIFPRAWWRPVTGLEVYGGPLFAFSATPTADPLNSRIAGGMARNALDGVPGGYLGTELDLGTRFCMLIGGTRMTVGLEGGVLFPGDALAWPDGKVMDPVYGGRFILDYRF